MLWWSDMLKGYSICYFLQHFFIWNCFWIYFDYRYSVASPLNPVIWSFFLSCVVHQFGTEWTDTWLTLDFCLCCLALSYKDVKRVTQSESSALAVGESYQCFQCCEHYIIMWWFSFCCWNVIVFRRDENISVYVMSRNFNFLAYFSLLSHWDCFSLVFLCGWIEEVV